MNQPAKAKNECFIYILDVFWYFKLLKQKNCVHMTFDGLNGVYILLEYFNSSKFNPTGICVVSRNTHKDAFDEKLKI